MNIKICNYEILNFDNFNLVMSEKGLSTITSSPILEALTELEQYREVEIPATKLHEVLAARRINTPDVLTFLKKCLTIIERPKQKPYEKIVIIHDTDYEQQSLNLLKSELVGNATFCSLSRLEISDFKDKTNLIIFLTHDYNYAALKSMYFKIANTAPKSGILIAHYTPDHYCVSQPYFQEIGNPCHFCHIDRLLNYEEKQHSQNNWSQLLKFSSEHGCRIPNKKKSQLQKALAMGMLASRIKLYSGLSPSRRHQDTVLASASINLINGRINEEVIPHWVLCKCQRGK